ncbi:MAG: hypothetical protein JWR16_1332 [Nevskia sp.]|nr:hypothetical protein [Nevskia sp.]
MSYILEALKRAERERRAGTSALLDEVSSPSTTTAAPAWQRWIVPAVISALVAALLTYLLVGRGTHPVAAPTPSAAATTPQTTTPQATAPPPAPSVPSSAASAESTPPTIEDDGRISSLNDLDDKPAPADTAAAVASTDADTDSAAPTRPGNARANRRPTLALSANAADDGAASTAATADDSDADAGAAEPAAAQPAQAAAPATAQNLREMPDAFRASFPAITVDVHAYSDDPAKRFVLIDGKRYRENDTLAQGPHIVGIVPAGIVFDWQGQRVLYAMNR